MNTLQKSSIAKKQVKKLDLELAQKVLIQPKFVLLMKILMQHPVRLITIRPTGKTKSKISLVGRLETSKDL